MKLSVILLVALLTCSALMSADTQPRPRLAWKADFQGCSEVTPEVVAGKQAIMLAPRPLGWQNSVRVFALDLTTGRRRWNAEMLYATSVRADVKRLYVRRPVELGGRQVLAIDPQSGKTLWSRPYSWPRGWGEPDLLVKPPYVLWLDEDKGLIAAVAATGKLLWTLPSVEWMGKTRRLLPVTVVGSKLYAAVLDSPAMWFVLDMRIGTANGDVPLPQHTEQSLHHVEPPIWSPRHNLMFVHEVYAAQEHHILQAVRKDLSDAWVKDSAGNFVLTDKVIVADTWEDHFSSDKGPIVGLDPGTGRELWRRPKPGNGRMESVVGEWKGCVVISEAKTNGPQGARRLIGLRPRDGRQLWSLDLPERGKPRVFGRSILVGFDWQKGVRPARVLAYR